jgi:hypothetical protein
MTPKNATTNARSTHCITGRLIQTHELRTGFASVTEVVVGRSFRNANYPLVVGNPISLLRL